MRLERRVEFCLEGAAVRARVREPVTLATLRAVADTDFGFTGDVGAARISWTKRLRS